METTPIAVTVFPDRARVTRQGRATLEAGAHQLVVDNLPLALLPASVRAAGRGTARARLLGVSITHENFVETPAEAVRALEQGIQKLEDKDFDILAEIAVLEKEVAQLDGLAGESRMLARGLANGKRTTEDVGAMFRFVRERKLEAQTALLTFNRERRALAKELDRLRRDLNQLRSGRPRQRYVAKVDVEVSAAGELELDLTYVVTNASWRSLYDLRVLDAQLEVTYLAQVQQNTGEAWPDVALTLSTAEPAVSLDVPELDPWYIRPLPPPMPPPPPRQRMASPQAKAKLTMAEQGAEMPMPAAMPAPAPLMQMEVEQATVSEAGPSLTYTLAARATIPGNNDPRKVTVTTLSLKPKMDYVTAPKLQQVCYRRATIKNESAYSLLAGEAQLFEKDDYLGAVTLDFVAPNQEFELALGADERMRVERELVTRDVDKTFIGDRRRIRYGYRIEVENLRDAPQTILVRDQLPVPRDEQIKVKLEMAEPKPNEHTDLNQLEWRLTLDKASKKSVRFEFIVEHPRTMEVIGLP